MPAILQAFCFAKLFLLHAKLQQCNTAQRAKDTSRTYSRLFAVYTAKLTVKNAGKFFDFSALFLSFHLSFTLFPLPSPAFSPDSKKFATTGIRIVPMRHFASLSVNQQKTPRKIGVFFLILHFVICCNNRVQYLANKLFIRKQHTIVLCLILHFLICYGNRLQYLANDLHCRKWHAKFRF